MSSPSQVVAIMYEVKDAQTQEVIDSNLDSRPLEFLLGAGQVISGLEKAVASAKKGDKLNLSIAPEDAYGVYQADFLQEVPRDQFEGISLEKGMTLFGQAEDGQTVQVIVKDFSDTSVMIDYNHPLAGKTLLFDVEIADMRKATAEEIMQGRAGGCGSGCGCGSNETHDSGGCCGGGGHSCGCH